MRTRYAEPLASPTPGTSPVGLELRIHGVHGTTPEAMLGVPSVVQVAGDGLTGVFRPADGKVPYRDLSNGPVVEAYTWGALTSGVGGAFGWLKRALWLLLLPFSLANLAYWARLELGREGGRARYGVVAVRLSSLLLTVFFLLTACLVCVNLFAWQCYRAGIPACPTLPGWFSGMAQLTPGRRLAIGVLGPTAVVGLLYVLSGTSLARYEATKDPSGDLMEKDRGAPILRHPELWRGTRRTTALRNVHIAAALATIALFVATHSWFTRHTDTPTNLVGVVGLLAATELVVAAALVVVPLAGDVEVPADEGLPGIVPSQVLMGAAAATVLLLEILLVVQPANAYAQFRDYYGDNASMIAIFVLLTILHLSLFTSERLQHRWSQVAVPLWFGLVIGGGTLFGFRFFHQLDRHGNRVLPAWTAWTVVAVLAASFLVLVLWHFRGTRARTTSSAWNGAGSSVLLASAAWIGLLFTTTVVTGVANYLNGDQSVAQLRTSTQAPRDYRPRLDDLTAAGATRLDPAAEKDLRRGRPIRHGTVTVDAAYVTASSGQPALFQLDDRTLEDVVLRLPDRTVQSPTRAYTVHSRKLRIVGPVQLVVTDARHTALVLPSVLMWAPIAQSLWLVLAALVLLGCWWVFRRHVAGPIRRQPASYFQGRHVPGRTEPLEVPVADRPGVRKARINAAFGHRAEQLLNYTGAVTAPLALALVGVGAAGLDLPTKRFPWLVPVSATAMYVILGASAGLVAVGAKLRESEGWRKTIGVIWDLVTFWPRAAHPLSPPCYTERVVPEVLTRLDWARRLHGQVLVSAHSQGSTIAVAALMRTTDLDGVRLITYGSQLRALYGRVFPRVFGPDDVGYLPTTGPITLRHPAPDLPPGVPPRAPAGAPAVPAGSLRDRIGVGSWVNVFRRGDPIGFRVFSDTFDDDHDRVALEVPQGEYGDPGPTILGHSGYQHSPEYRAAVGEWTGEPFVGPPETIAGVTPLPKR